MIAIILSRNSETTSLSDSNKDLMYRKYFRSRDFLLLLYPSQIYVPVISREIGLFWCSSWTSFGVKSSSELCGLNPLYSSLQSSIFSLASCKDKNQLTFKPSSRKLPLNDPVHDLAKTPGSLLSLINLRASSLASLPNRLWGRPLNYNILFLYKL